MTNDSGFLTSHQDLSGYIPRSGGAVLTADSLGRSVNTNRMVYCGGVDNGNGASVTLYGKDSDSLAGVATIQAYNVTNNTYLQMFPTGEARYINNGTTKNLAMQEDVVPRSGGSVMKGTTIGKVDNSSYLNLCGGLNWSNGAAVSVLGKDTDSNAGNILLHPNNGTQEKIMWLRPDGTWMWNGTACQITSDQRLKQQIAEIDDKLLDAWEDVELSQFKYNDAVDEKGDKARLHTGYVVQQIDKACASHGVDVSEYGLYCHEEYPEETEEVEVEQEDGTKVKERKVIREASEHYSLRYTETLVVECAYLRREISRLKEELNLLKTK